MKNLLSLFVLLVLSSSFSASASVLRGDVNGSGSVSIDDVTCLIDYLLSGNASGVSLAGADCNQDGGISIDDLTSLIDYLLSNSWPGDAHEWVDLGLPSGTLWATCNIGADNPEDYGDYFAWGETEPKEVYSWTNYKWCNGSYNTLTKYCSNSDYGADGFVDNKKQLDPEDDAAYVNWGSSWRMPTVAQLQELVENCTWQWTTLNGVQGQLAKGPNGKTLFLPAASYYYDSTLSEDDITGDYWSLDGGFGTSYLAFDLYFESSGYVYWDDFISRRDGLSVRPVRLP